jgi:hypothetical protein
MALTATRHDTATIVSMTVIASAAATLLHEGLGHGVTAWLRGDVPTELTSNHLSDLRPDRLVDAGGTIVNLIVGGLCLLAARGLGERANARYFFWLLGALNLLPGAGYFLFSGILGVGDWSQVIAGLSHQALLRVGMSLIGAWLYISVVKLLMSELRPFLGEMRDYNAVARVPYYAAGLFSCVAGAFDPLGIRLLFLSTIPAAFGGSSGLLWGDSRVQGTALGTPLYVGRSVAWWIAAAALGSAYVVVLGRGVAFAH